MLNLKREQQNVMDMYNDAWVAIQFGLVSQILFYEFFVKRNFVW